MVKGISKQVILVKPKDTDVFEQAIFIVKKGANVTEKDLLQQAGAMGEARAKTRPVWRFLLSFFFGAAGMGLLWLLTSL